MAKSYVESMLGESEKIVLITRQHWLALLRTIAVEILVIAILVVIVAVSSTAFPLAWLALFLVIIPILGMVRDFAVWWNKQYIVTNRRVMQIAGIFNKNVTDSSLEKVNDVMLEQSALGRIFNYGNVQILTASELGVNLFQRIGDPIRFKTAMLNAKERLDREGTRSWDAEDQFPTDIPALIAQLDELRQKGIITAEEFQIKKAELLSKM